MDWLDADTRAEAEALLAEMDPITRAMAGSILSGMSEAAAFAVARGIPIEQVYLVFDDNGEQMLTEQEHDAYLEAYYTDHAACKRAVRAKRRREQRQRAAWDRWVKQEGMTA